MHRRCKGLIAAATMLLPATASGQGFEIDWYSIDGGGGLYATSGGWIYSVSGTIGQYDASPPIPSGALDPQWTVSGGFWGAGLICPCDIVQDGVIDVFDLLQFLEYWFAGDIRSDYNMNGIYDSEIFDLLDLLSCWFPASAPGSVCP